MSLVVPNEAEEDLLAQFLSAALSLKLFSNDVSPAAGSTAATFTEVAGGGYVDIALQLSDWTITPGDPTTAVASQQTFTFTGVTNSPGSIYGYYVVRDSDGLLMWAERFDSSVVPFVPTNGSVVKITPRFTGQSVV